MRSLQRVTGERVSPNVPTAFTQVYSDWWYAWCLMYLTGTYRDVYIVLKRSLKWLPILGWVR